MSQERAVDESSRVHLSCPTSPHAVFSECPQCGGEMRAEHAHYRCRGCGWRDSCCD